MSGPTQSLYVETQALYDCADGWTSDAVTRLAAAKSLAANGEHQGYLFGVLLASLQQPHDTFASDATDILGTAGEVATDFGEALAQVAKDYESTDANVSTLATKTAAGL
ncbi:hypothetical protein [Nocardioides sp.]|uniref:hypothetical protein n=1 Tax=Nocardioides sp. TaxID=35761 RepID=UPI002C68D5E7|nr:hypothetical protein [Nocardioides sp.]HXH81038.1 hypothetical protein [Nocardioides sp.]